MDVTLVRWPDEGDRRQLLREQGRPRLLLVDDGPPPSPTADCFEDWIRVPADELEVRSRVEALRLRYEDHGPSVPELDDDGVVRFGGDWTSVPPVEARLLAALIERYGAVVSREALSRAGWPGGAPGRNALDVHVLRLRRRLAGVGLQITTVRSRGYLLESSDSVQEGVLDA
ncbi:MAG: helix-turn-helix domain-containing protein [Acidimicrobiia bacterium]|nr:helix-turn-helix domain-containing protein [Acidimicrobiia bacterium]